MERKLILIWRLIISECVGWRLRIVLGQEEYVNKKLN